jgi:hypothetical protein
LKAQARSDNLLVQSGALALVRTLLVALLLSAGTPAFAEPPPNATPTTLAESFFKALEIGETGKAYRGIFTAAIIVDKPAELQNLANQIDSTFKIFGKPVGWETMKSETLSASLVETTYLVRTEKAPIFFRIQFYKGPSGWGATNAYFTDTYKNLSQ